MREKRKNIKYNLFHYSINLNEILKSKKKNINLKVNNKIFRMCIAKPSQLI